MTRASNKAVASSKISKGKARGDAPAQTAAALTLKEIQALFQDAILNKDDRILALVTDNSRTTRETLFGVYKNGYVGRLVEVLGNDYEDLRTYCGDEAFDKLARTYISEYPSRNQNARWFGAKLPVFLAEDKRFARRPQLSELATIEQALSNAFDALDAPHVTLQTLAGHAPDLWGRLTFVPHPSVTRLQMTTNAFAIWRAIKNGAPPPRLKTKITETLVTWRQGTMPMIREMNAEETMMWTEASRGVRFDVLCELAATFDNPEEAAMRAAGYLQGWISTEMLTSAALAAQASPATKRPLRVPQ